MSKLPLPSLLSKRVIVYLFVLLILQCIIAYGALLVFDALPQSITGVPEDHVVQRESQRGAVNLIQMQIKQNSDLPVQQVIDNLQPYFGYPLQLLPAETVLDSDVAKEFAQYGYAYDEVEDLIYVNLNDGHMLRLGPILMRDILESNLMPFGVFIFIWSVFSAAIFFLLIYLAFIRFWHDLVDIRQTAEQIGQGNLKARAENVTSWLFKPLSNILNNMATHIQHLVITSETITHAMAHELRTPLARMRFELSMLDEATNEDERLELRKGIRDDLNELELLIKASLEFFKLQQNGVELNLNSVSLKDWSQKLCDSLDLLRPAHFRVACKSEDAVALIDTRLADLAVKNLLLNAFKYAKSRVELNVFKKENAVVIEVDDDGDGISFESREKVFLPFSRLDTSRTKATGGYGLGLAYVRLIAEFHYGNAFVITSPLGGARFVITLQSGE